MLKQKKRKVNKLIVTDELDSQLAALEGEDSMEVYKPREREMFYTADETPIEIGEQEEEDVELSNYKSFWFFALIIGFVVIAEIVFIVQIFF